MAVNVYIMRHGEAQPVAASDAQRQLTPAGQAQVRQSGEYLHSVAKHFDLVLVSPYVRAQQTWQIVNDVCPNVGKVLTCDDLVPEASPAQMHDFLDAMLAQMDAENVLLVSHMPIVSYLVAELSTTQMAPIFMTAAVAHVSYDTQTMTGDFLGVKAPR